MNKGTIKDLYQESLFAVIIPLIEEHVLCTLKIKQLKLRRNLTESEEQAEILTILENLRRQDEHRLIVALRSIGDPGI
jgi:hypothetical protein